MELNARFELGESVGRDELGEVLRATEIETGRKAAIKRFEPWALANEDGRTAFEKALRALRRIRPARTPPVAAFQIHGPSGWIASRWVDAPSLASILESSGILGTDETCSVACGLLDALQELHSTGSAHGGLSPRKVLLAQGVSAGSVVITDPFQHFLYSVADPVKTSRTDPDRYLGLPQYFSPEQAQGKQPDERSDLYVVGLLMYEMLTGKSPFASNSVGTTLKRQIFEKPLPLRLARPGLKVPAELEEIIFRALSKEPDKRFASAREFRRAVTSLRDSAEEALERLASPMGIAPVGVLAGEDVPTEDHAEAHPDDVAEPQRPGEERSHLSTAARNSDNAAAPTAELTTTDSTSGGAVSGQSDASGSTDDLSVNGDGSLRGSRAASGMSADFEVADSDDSDTDSGDDSAESGDPNSPGLTSASGVDAGRNKKDKKNKKKPKTGKTGAVPAVVASPALGKRDDKSSAGVSNGGADAAALSRGARQAPESSPRHQIKLTGPVTAAPLDVDNDAELGWFAEGANEEAIATSLHIAAPRSDEAQRNSRFFTLGLVALLLVIVGVVAVVTTTTPAPEEPSRGRDDESQAEAESATAESPGTLNAASLVAAEQDTAPAADADAPNADVQAPEAAEADVIEQALEPDTDGLDTGNEAADLGEPAVPADVQVDVAVPEPVADVQVAPPTPPVVAAPPVTPPPVVEAQPQDNAADAERESTAAAERDERRTRARELAREGDGLRSSSPEQAAERYREAIRLDSSVGAAHFGLGEIAFQSRDFAGAVTHYRAATRNGGRASYYTRLGQAYFRLDDREAAIAAFEEAIERGDISAQAMLDRVRGQ
ncbi:MAG: serine/threonine protein kinase [Myxococcales bacterium]|nr:serine/threonine protein kinase [Myxococcales bacterium]